MMTTSYCCKGASLLLLSLFFTASLALSPLLYYGSTASPTIQTSLLHVGGSSPASSSSAGSSINRRQPRNQPRSSISSSTTTQLFVGGGSHSLEPEQPPQRQPQQRWASDYGTVTPDLEVPTITQQEPTPLSQIPPRPKIVVFGASGKIGRRILKRLLECGMDMDVVAFVRDSNKLQKVLYDEEDLVLDNLIDKNDGSSSKKGGGGGPKLYIVVSDVVSRRDVYQKTFETDHETSLLNDWVDKAKDYFRGKGWDYDNSTDIKSFEDDDKIASDVDILESGGEEALRDAISGSTILISCLGTNRPSNLWTDYLRVPLLRVFRKNAAKWCSDATHPYYVNYLTTKKILEEAEKEQCRREAAIEFERERLLLEEQMKRGRRKQRGQQEEEEEGFESEIAARLRKLRMKRNSVGTGGGYSSRRGGDNLLPSNGQLRTSSNDRIKFIRISHLMVGRSPFRPWNALTNIIWSQLSKFETMGEQLLQESKLVDTIVLRPGELTDAVRNGNHTSLQLRVDGRVDYPSLVGREDVADLAVVAALTKTSTDELNITQTGSDVGLGGDAADTAILPKQQQPPAHHYKWAMRWTGQHLSPPQGLRPDGLASAALCFIKALKEQKSINNKLREKERRIKSYHGGHEWMKLQSWRRRLKPYGQSVAISIPVYATMIFVGWYLFGQVFADLFTRLRRLSMPQVIMKLLQKI